MPRRPVAQPLGRTGMARGPWPALAVDMIKPSIQANDPAIPLEEPALEPVPAHDAVPAGDAMRPAGPRPWPFDPARLAALFAAPRPRRVTLWDEAAQPHR